MSEEEREDRECLTASISVREIMDLASSVKLLLPSVEKLVHVVEGNGDRKGLKSEVDSLKEWRVEIDKDHSQLVKNVAALKDWKEGIERFRDKWLWPTIVAVGLAVTFFVAGVLTHRIDITFH